MKFVVLFRRTTSTGVATTARVETTTSSTAEEIRPRGAVEEVGEVTPGGVETRAGGGVVAGPTMGAPRRTTSAGTLELAGAGRTRLADSRGIRRNW